MTTLELSAVEVASLPTEGTFWIVREGVRVARYPELTFSDGEPPAVFTQACAPCECGGSRIDPLHRAVPDRQHLRRACPHCCIELVGPCPTCKGDPSWPCGSCGRPDFGGNVGTVHVGWAYAVGQPLPIVCGVGNQPNDLECIDVDGGLIYHWPAGKPPHYEVDDYEATDLTDQLAHYNVAALAAGGWYALELRRA